MALTDVTARTSKSKDKAFKLSDSAGLYLLVNPSGSKYWRLKYRYAGKEKTFAIGVYPEVTLAEARQKRDEARKLLRDGFDPTQTRKAKKRQQRLNSENAFENVASEWCNLQSDKWTEGHKKRVLGMLQKDVFPVIGTRPINEIKPPEILEVIRRIEKRDALDISSRALQKINAVFRYAIQTERTEQNPAESLKGINKTRKVKHRPALSRKDLPGFLKKLDDFTGQPETRLALNLLLLTFVRPGELRFAKWEEFDLVQAEWRIPEHKMKMGVEHLVPLSSQVIQVLENLQPLTGKYEFLFPCQTNIRKPISENTLLYAMYRMGYRGKATAHGFRATASSILNESGFHHDAIERQLAHLEKNKVRAAYHRSEYLEERKRMMQWWANYIDGFKGEQNIVAFTKNQ